MSWSELEGSLSDEQAKKAAAQKEQATRDLCQLCHRVFSTEDGQQFLTHLSQRFIYGNDTELEHPNYAAAAAYHNGESGVVKYIHTLIQRSQTL